MKHHLAAAPFAAILFSACIASAAVAQGTIHVNPLVLISGQTATVTYSNPSRANSTITITIDNGVTPNPTVVEIRIALDASGKGSTPWTVPNWDSASFNEPDAKEVSLPVVPSNAPRSLAAQ